MKSAVYLGKKQVEIRTVPTPRCGAQDVLIRNICSSICGTDVAVFMQGPNTGHRVTIGGEFGHETVSRVSAVGERVTDFKVGQRVYPYPLFAKGDTKRAGTIGGFSEEILIPNAIAGHSLYPVPHDLSDKTACLIEPFTVGCRAARRAMPKPDETAAVFGCGTIGIAAAIALKWFGVRKVMLCDPSAFRLSIAQSMGFAVCNQQKNHFATEASAYFGTASGLDGAVPDVDIFIDAAGAESVLDGYMQLGKFESRFVSVAVNSAIRQLDLLRLTYAQQCIIGSGGYKPEDVETVFAIMQSKRWNIESIVTHEFSLDEIAQAIRMAAKTEEALNVMIRFPSSV